MVLFETLGLKESYSLKKVMDSLPHLRVYEAQSGGAIHNLLRRLDAYVCSEYFPDVLPGLLSRDGVRCEDLQNLSFEDNSFDIVITQDIFEHIRNPKQAWKEVYRVLKPSGFHIFTIPFQRNRETVRRVELRGGKDIFVLPKVFHSDGIRNGLVYTDFGHDIFDCLEDIGFSTKVFFSDDLAAEDVSRYRLYWNCVFVSRKHLK